MTPAALRRVITAAVASLMFVLTGLVGAHQASATTTPWSLMTVAQKQSAMSYAMYTLLNQERALYHLAPVGGSPTIFKASYAHNLAMAKYNLMSHQCPGEASPGTRIRNAGYNWRSWGENVGWTSDISIAGIQYMEKLMFAEKAPYDGHRQNILGNFKAIAISIYIDSVHHKVWYTQDFAYPYYG